MDASLRAQRSVLIRITDDFDGGFLKFSDNVTELQKTDDGLYDYSAIQVQRVCSPQGAVSGKTTVGIEICIYLGVTALGLLFKIYAMLQFRSTNTMHLNPTLNFKI